MTQTDPWWNDFPCLVALSPESRAKAVEMRLAGATYREIKDALAITGADVWTAIKEDPSSTHLISAERSSAMKNYRARKLAEAGGRKICPGCRESKPFTNEYFGSRGKKKQGQLGTECLVCHSNRSKVRWRKIKMEALIHYSNGEPHCGCCGEKNFEFLTFDHIEGGGRKHRMNDKGTRMMGQWLKKHGYPPGFRVLCMNCNTSFGHWGYCPHQAARRNPELVMIEDGARAPGRGRESPTGR